VFVALVIAAFVLGFVILMSMLPKLINRKYHRDDSDGVDG
jgi:hypothetical protein